MAIQKLVESKLQHKYGVYTYVPFLCHYALTVTITCRTQEKIKCGATTSRHVYIITSCVRACVFDNLADNIFAKAAGRLHSGNYCQLVALQ